MFHGFTGLCSHMLQKYPKHYISPLRINGSAIESVFSSLKYISGGHLSAVNYSSAIGSLLTSKEPSINPHAEKEYRTNILSLS